MQTEFWNDRWQKGEIGFHQPVVNDLLTGHWPALGLAPGSEVFVPLCGKSLDMAWLAGSGHRVVGAELSELAVRDFFAERGLEPVVTGEGSFTVFRAGPYEIWCGDIFALPAAATARAAAVYDRAALVAFPPAMQPRYAAKLAALTPAAAPILLVALAYPDGQLEGPPFSTPLSQVASLFGGTHAIALLEARGGLESSPNLKERGLTALDESVYVLTRKS